MKKYRKAINFDLDTKALQKIFQSKNPFVYMIKRISEKTAKQLRAAADQDDVSGQMASILSGEEKEKKPSGKSVKIDGEVFDRYFTNIDKKQISSIVESALRMYFAGQTE